MSFLTLNFVEYTRLITISFVGNKLGTHVVAFPFQIFIFLRSSRIHNKLYFRLTKKLKSIILLSYGHTLIKRKLIGN